MWESQAAPFLWPVNVLPLLYTGGHKLSDYQLLESGQMFAPVSSPS